MSPNEAQLRAALRAGEGEPLDVDAVVSGAVQVQRARRHRLASAVGAVIVIAGVAGGSAALLNRGDDDTSSGSALRRPATHSAAAGGGSRPATAFVPKPGVGARSDVASEMAPAAAVDDATSAANGIACPAQLPRLALPGGGGTGQFGGDQPLFNAAVAAIKVCSYLGGGSVVGGSQVLSGTPATELVASLNNASAKRVAQMCPDIENGLGESSLAIYAVTPSGRQLRVVTAKLGCGGVATNGTATRYSWSPPNSLTPLVRNRTAVSTETPVPKQTR